MSDTKILVAAHKKYWMPEDSIYLPLHVGKSEKKDIGYTGDDTGDNISWKNPNYCELTGIYWAWKNLNADYAGLVHYRRYFMNHNLFLSLLKGKRNSVLTKEKLELLLKKYDIILPNKRNYYIETNRSHYNHAHNSRDLDVTEQIIKEKYPQYAKAFDVVMNRSWAHMFNMFIMKKEYFDSYCEWLFSILEELEKRIDITSYSAYEARVFGFISELLLDVWVETNGLKYKAINVMFMEKQNWIVKGSKFLKRKFTAK